MPPKCLLYYITDRSAFPGDEFSRRRRLLEKIREAAWAGVDYIQLREKDLSTRELESLAREAVSVIRETALEAALLINARTDIALAVEADGVHLRSDDVNAREVRAVWKVWSDNCGAGTPFDRLKAGSARQNSPRDPLIGVSCHSLEEVIEAANSTATFAVFAPVFEKKDAEPTGLELLKKACRGSMPVLALGGITLSNAHSCLDAGAAGIAAIRLFQENNIAMVVKKLRG
jgi:thiamine-phosphate pyrophosphorylase